MARIIPWKLPDVQGGSVGGYTPAPTPEPLTSYPYDLDTIVTDTAFNAIFWKDAGSNCAALVGKFSISGVKILDTAAVASVIALIEVSDGTTVYTRSDSSTATVTKGSSSQISVEIGSIMTLAGGSADFTDKYDRGKNFINGTYNGRTDSYPGAVSLDSTTLTATVVSITVYNGNGVAIQEWEPGE